jgi:hypothetical protein
LWRLAGSYERKRSKHEGVFEIPAHQHEDNLQSRFGQAQLACLLDALCSASARQGTIKNNRKAQRD